MFLKQLSNGTLRQMVEVLKYMWGSCARDWTTSGVSEHCSHHVSEIRDWCSEVRLGQYSYLLLPAHSTAPGSHVGGEGGDVRVNTYYLFWHCQIKEKHPKGSMGIPVSVMSLPMSGRQRKWSCSRRAEGHGLG